MRIADSGALAEDERPISEDERAELRAWIAERGVLAVANDLRLSRATTQAIASGSRVRLGTRIVFRRRTADLRKGAR